MPFPFVRFLKYLVGVGVVGVLVYSFTQGIFGWARREKNPNAIGVITLMGPIVRADPVIEQLRRYAQDKEVAAIIVRLESPGGGVGASQEIYEAIFRVRQKKPVVASMGGIATSGALYIASACSAIVANPGTLTGSIGVIIQLIDLSELFSWARIRVEVIKTGEFKDAGGVHRPLTTRENRYFQELSRKVLAQFIRDIRRGRGDKISERKLWEIADGRIFTGDEARSLGLVDELGGWETSIEVAKRLAGIVGEPEILKPRKRIWDRFFGGESLSEKGSITQLFNPLWAIFIP